MYIAPQRSFKPPETARLTSFPQQAKCVSFWYLIYGGNIGELRTCSLHALDKESMEPEFFFSSGIDWIVKVDVS